MLVMHDPVVVASVAVVSETVDVAGQIKTSASEDSTDDSLGSTVETILPERVVTIFARIDSGEKLRGKSKMIWRRAWLLRRSRQE